MIPVGPLASLIVAGLVAALRRKREGKAAPVFVKGAAAHGGLIVRVFALLALAVIALVAVLTANLPLSAVGCVLFSVLVVPSIATFPLVRLGLVRPTLWLWRLVGDPFSAAESRPAAAWHAAAALLRAPSERSAASLERHLAGCVELGTTGAAASARIALARGDRERARRLFRALEGLDRKSGAPRAIRKLANEFAALDAVGHGAWRSVVVAPPGPTTRLGRLVTLLGTRLAAASPVPAWRVWLAWAVAPHRRRTRALVNDALRAVPVATAAPVAPSLAAFAALLARPAGALQRADVEAATLSLDAVRAAPNASAYVQRRALALGTTALADGVLTKVCREAEEDLVRLFVDEHLPAAWLPSGPTGDEVREFVRHERFERLEALLGDLARRRASAGDLPEADEWCAWADVREASDDLLADARGPEDRDAIVSAVSAPLTSFAVRLCNVRSRRILARHMFLFLRDLSDPGRASDAHGLAERNVSATREESLRGTLPAEGTMVSAVPAVARRRTLYGLAIFAGLFAWAPVVLSVEPSRRAGALLMWTSIVAGVAAAIAMGRRVHGLVDMVMTPDGLLLHTLRGQFLALPNDVASVRVRGASIHIVLRRRPRWLPWRVHSVASSPVNADRHRRTIAAWCARDAGDAREDLGTLAVT